MATWTETLTSPVDWLTQSDTVSKWDVGKSRHLNTDPANSSATRDTPWDEELPGERVGHQLKSITKLQDSWGWFASLLTEVVTEKLYTSPPRPQAPRTRQTTKSLHQEMALPLAHSLAQRCESQLSAMKDSLSKTWNINRMHKTSQFQC